MSILNFLSGSKNKSWRERAFPFVVGIPAFGLCAVAAVEFLTAWILREPGETPHLWHIAELVALAILLALPLFLIARRPKEKPLLAQFLVLSSIVSAIALAPFKPPAAGIVVIGVLILVFYPDRRLLFGIGREGFPSLILLTTTLVMACYLAPIAQREVVYQIYGDACQCDIHAALLHWIGSALMMALLVLAGLLISTKRPGWQTLSYIIASIYLFLGIIAFIVPDYAGSWGYLGGLLALCAGGIYIAFTLAEISNMRWKALVQKEKAERYQYTWPASETPETQDTDNPAQQTQQDRVLVESESAGKR